MKTCLGGRREMKELTALTAELTWQQDPAKIDIRGIPVKTAICKQKQFAVHCR